MASIGTRRDQKLEQIRKDIPTLPDAYKILKDLVTTPKIHPAYLYYTVEGLLLLKELCILLSGTKPTNLYAGWEDFGIRLGLEPNIINVIKYDLHSKDSLSYVFEAYIQKEDATIENILVSLYEIKRHDILLEIEGLVRKACQSILQKYNINENKEVIKPISIPCGLFIFKDFNKSIQEPAETRLVTEKFQQVSHISEKKVNSVKRYTKTILLTYSRDANEIVKELLIQLRKPRNGGRLGILVLHEQQHILNKCPEEFIWECFEQIDYVFPIMTLEYLKEIKSNNTNTTSSPLENPDHKYVKYIYRLMSAHYVGNGCKNTKVRCIIPDELGREVSKHPAMKHSLFQAWIRFSQIDTLIEAILKIKS